MWCSQMLAKFPGSWHGALLGWYASPAAMLRGLVGQCGRTKTHVATLLAMVADPVMRPALVRCCSGCHGVCLDAYQGGCGSLMERGIIVSIRVFCARDRPCLRRRMARTGATYSLTWF